MKMDASDGQYIYFSWMQNVNALHELPTKEKREEEIERMRGKKRKTESASTLYLLVNQPRPELLAREFARSITEIDFTAVVHASKLIFLIARVICATND